MTARPGAGVGRASCITLILSTGLSVIGCTKPGNILVDLSALPPRFTIDREGEPKLMFPPRITEFAVGVDVDKPIWELAASGSGASIDEFAVIYGQIPEGYRQVSPPDDAKPPELKPGVSYYVACGGPSHVYRIIFGLPVSGRPPASRPATTTQPVRLRMSEPTARPR